MQNSHVKGMQAENKESDESSREPNLAETFAEPGKKFVQQAFHPSLFYTRPRSSSLGNTSASEPSDTSKYAHNCESTPCPPSWQKVPMNKHLQKKRKMRESPSPESVTTKNQFEGLSIDLTESEPTSKKQSKPPPIILYGIQDVNKLTELLETTAQKSQFSYKIVNKNQLRMNVTDIETYKKVITLIRENGLIGHTFNRKDNRPYRIVIRNLHPTTPISIIKEEIQSTGNTVTGEIINAKFGPDKKPTSTFFVNLLPGPNNKAVKELKYIYHQSIVIEDPKKRKSIVQCQRCQQYGHSKNYCMRPFRCVKCGQSHKTSECTKTNRDTPAQCALCNGPHPANYRGCKVYQEILARRRKTQENQPTRTYATSSSHKPAEQILQHPNQDKKAQYTYSEILQNNNLKPAPTNQAGLEAIQIILKQSEKLEAIIQQMSTLMSLMTKLVDKLTK